MLSKKRQKKYLSKKEKKWLLQLHVFSESGDPEAIHQLRLNVKKVKAFVQMMKACSDKRIVKDFGPLKKMFRQAGKIRDAGNSIKLLNEFQGVPAEYRERQERLGKEAAILFVERTEGYRKKGKKAVRRLQADLHAVRSQCIKDWYASRLIKIGVLLTASGDLLHEARKRIKELLYLQGLLPKALVAEIGLDKDYLDKLQDAIGNWHDMAVIVATYAGREGADSQAMVRECGRREGVVRGLASDFYLKAHLI
jgi:CHAD domain-containing protein